LVLVSQDFRAAFELGSDDKSIAVVDADGVAGSNSRTEPETSTNRRAASRPARTARHARRRIGAPMNFAAATPGRIGGGPLGVKDKRVAIRELFQPHAEEVVAKIVEWPKREIGPSCASA